MRTTRLLFDDAETAESIARRIVRAFNPGETFCVKGKFFRVSNIRTANETSRINIEGDKYTLILNIGEPSPIAEVPKISEPSIPPRTLPEPPSAIVNTQVTPKEIPSESGEYKIVRENSAKVTREGPQKILPLAGQRWQTKDSRRANSPSFTVLKVDDAFAYTDKGGRIALKRWRSYRLVEDGVVF
jgi:hypothetical protein